VNTGNSTVPTTIPEIVTAQEMSTLLGVSDDTVYRLGRQGRLKTVHVGKLVRFFRSDALAFLIRNTIEPTDVPATR
jgi:excisionase family DNA binding protein